jgi:hypothetical protein
MDKVCHVEGDFFLAESELGSDPKYDRLRNWRDGRLNMSDYTLPDLFDELM